MKTKQFGLSAALFILLFLTACENSSYYLLNKKILDAALKDVSLSHQLYPLPSSHQDLGICDVVRISNFNYKTNNREFIAQKIIVFEDIGSRFKRYAESSANQGYPTVQCAYRTFAGMSEQTITSKTEVVLSRDELQNFTAGAGWEGLKGTLEWMNSKKAVLVIKFDTRVDSITENSVEELIYGFSSKDLRELTDPCISGDSKIGILPNTASFLARPFENLLRKEDTFYVITSVGYALNPVVYFASEKDSTFKIKADVSALSAVAEALGGVIPELALEVKGNSSELRTSSFPKYFWGANGLRLKINKETKQVTTESAELRLSPEGIEVKKKTVSGKR